MMVMKINTNYQNVKILLTGILVGLLPLFLLGYVASPQVFVYASSSNNNNNEVSCFDRGIVDGEDHPFSQQTYERCGDDYYQGYLQGCMSVEGNNRDICESATDA